MLPLIRWVTPNQAEVDSFREQVKAVHGIELTDMEARDLATSYIHIFQFMTHELDDESAPPAPDTESEDVA